MEIGQASTGQRSTAPKLKYCKVAFRHKAEKVSRQPFGAVLGVKAKENALDA